jgi:hypothetical protein
MRYCYHNRAYIASGAAHGVFCDPVRRRTDGRCVAAGGKQLVIFADGHLAIVVRRCLRLRKRCRLHGL